MTPSRSFLLREETRTKIMSARIMEAQLLRLLTADDDMRKRGCEASARPSGGIAILAGGVDRGSWAWMGRDFIFTPAPGVIGAAVIVGTAVEALIATRASLCPQVTSAT